MELSIQVNFSEPHERRLLDVVRQYIGIAFPQPAGGWRHPHENPERSLKQLLSGPVTVGQLLDAQRFIAGQAQACERQAQAEYWLEAIPDVTCASGQSDSTQGARGAVVLIADPAGIRELLAQTRCAQARDARAALALVEHALAALRSLASHAPAEMKSDTEMAVEDALAGAAAGAVRRS